MASKIANGNAANGMSSARPPFRRQGSSTGAQHPMTVALTPTQRVDYSVTKGGARTWAVLLVFMFLCSSLYTVFSAKEVAELGVDLDGDGDLDLDADLDDDVDEVAAQQKHALKDTTPTKDDHRGHDRKNDAPTPQEEIETADDDEAPVETTLEEKLFAGLRAKVQKLSKYVKNKVQGKNEDDEDEEEKPVKKEKHRRQKKKPEPKEEEEKEEDKPRQPARKQRKEKKEAKRQVKEEEEEEEEEKKVPKKKAQQLRWNPKKKREELIVNEEDEDENDNDDDDDNEDEAENEKDDDEDQEENDEEEDDKKEETKEDEKKVDVKEEKKEEKEKEEEDEEDDDEDEDDDEKEVVVLEPKAKTMIKRNEPPPPSLRVSTVQVRRVKTAHITDSAPARECRRKNCPTDFGIEPRKSLLKSKALSSSGKRYQIYDPNEEDDDDDDEDDDDENEEEEEEGAGEEDDGEEQQQSYAEVVAIKKYRSTGREAYKRHAITNRDDHKHRDDLDQADHLVEKHRYEEGIELFDRVLRALPDSPRAHFGKGRAYDIRSEFESDDSFVDRALKEYEEVLENDETPDALFKQAANRVIERARYRGNMHRALNAQRTLIDRFPEEKKFQIDFGLTFLMMKRHDDARKVFKNILDSDPNNALALAYYGYILKVADDDIEGGVHLMRKGLLRGGDEITDPKFYYHLGDGLMQLGRPSEAYKVYEQGAELGLFLSAHQRSMYNIEGLTARPWWTLEQTSYTKNLRTVERQWVAIRAEALAALEYHPDEFEDENSDLTIDGEWRALRLLHNEEWDEDNCEIVPQTCAILREFRESSNASRSSMKLSVLSSGTRVLPHCGATNCRLQAHLGLVVPSEARIRVASDIRGWKTGRFIVFDDSFEHELSFAGASSSAFRLVLVIDLWHPEMDIRHRVHLSTDDD